MPAMMIPLAALVASALAQSADPAVHLSWRGRDATMWVRAPAGEHVAPDAPFDVSLSLGERILAVSGMGEDLAPGLPVGDVRGREVSGVVRASLCEDGGMRCRLVEVRVEGVAADARRGSLALSVAPYVPPEDAVPEPDRTVAAAPFPRQIDATTAHAAGVSRATARGVPLLLDFGAVWCPPCQRLDAEVFFALPRPSVVDGVERAWIDVDDPSSWTLKDRYAVGGYPTVVAVDAATGAELGRLVGYPGRDDTIAWLDAVVTGGLAQPSETVSAEEAADLAWRAIREGREDAARDWLAAADRAPSTVSYRLARFHLEPSLEDATWLAERAPERALDWVGALRGPARDDPAVRAVVRRAAQAGLSGASAESSADLLAVAADLTDDPAERGLLYGAAANALRGALTGEAERDKGLVGWLAWLEEQAGWTDRALGRLEAARATFPDEPTFHLGTARLLLRMGLPAEARAAAEAGLETSWGDNRLTAGKVVVETLIALGRRADAVLLVDRILAELPVPPDGLDVRTGRMRAALREAVEDAP